MDRDDVDGRRNNVVAFILRSRPLQLACREPEQQSQAANANISGNGGVSVMPAFCRPTSPHLSFATVTVENGGGRARRIEES
jgi:hypothetical protein